jgi:hypothetical protein
MRVYLNYLVSAKHTVTALVSASPAFYYYVLIFLFAYRVYYSEPIGLLQ